MKPTLNDVQALATDLAAHHVSYNRNHILREVTLLLEKYPEPRDDFAHQLARQIQRNQTLVERFERLQKQLTGKTHYMVTGGYPYLLVALAVVAAILVIILPHKALILTLGLALGLLITVYYRAIRSNLQTYQLWYDVHLKPLEPVVAHGQQLTERLTYTWKNPYAGAYISTNARDMEKEVHLMGLLTNLNTRQDLLEDKISEEHLEPLTKTTRDHLEAIQRQLMDPINVADVTLIDTPEK